MLHLAFWPTPRLKNCKPGSTPKIGTQTSNIAFRGANEEQAESLAFVGVAFSLSLLLMFVLLVTQFNSFYQSVLILFAVILSTAGY